MFHSPSWRISGRKVVVLTLSSICYSRMKLSFMHIHVWDSSTTYCMGYGTQVTAKAYLPLVCLLVFFYLWWFICFYKIFTMVNLWVYVVKLWGLMGYKAHCSLISKQASGKCWFVYWVLNKKCHNQNIIECAIIYKTVHLCSWTKFYQLNLSMYKKAQNIVLYMKKDF